MINLKEEIMGALARAYCTKENENKILDADLLNAACDEVMKVLEKDSD